MVQLRLKQATTAERVRVGRELIASVGDLAMIVMNDDVAAAEALGVTVHLGQGDPGVERATRAGISFGRSAGTPEEARRAEAEGLSTSVRERSGRRRASGTPGPPSGRTASVRSARR